MIELESIFEAIHDPDGSVVDDSFIQICQKLLQKIEWTRCEMQFSTYERNRIIILVNELHYSALLHAGRRRKSGDLEFNSHLVGTVENLLDDQNLTGLTSLLSGLKHDDIEDLGLSTEQLFRTNVYRDQLKNVSDLYLVKLHQNVFRIVSGTTKVKRETRKQTKEETFKKLLEFIRDHGVRVGYVKIADRSHNIKTLSGHGEGEIDKQKDIALETAEIYLPLSRLFKIPQSEEKLLSGCLKFLNPDFLSDYDTLMAQKGAEFLNKYKNKIEGQFFDGRHYSPETICEVNFVTRSLGGVLHQYNVDVPLTKLKISNLPIDYLDPMYDVVVLVDQHDHINPLIGKVIEKFSVGGLNINASKLGLNRGILLRIYNKAFGGRIYFRLNDRVSEARSKRGLLANIDDKTPPGIRRGIANILEKVAFDTTKIFHIAQQEFLQPRIIVYTPKNLRVELPRGATALDFADKIHEDVLKGAQSVSVCDDLWGQGQREISLFDDLPHGVVVFIDSCLSSRRGRTPDPSLIKVDPGWRHFCQTGARESILKYLRSSDAISLAAGKKYLQHISDLCGESQASMMTMIKKFYHQWEQESDEKIWLHIGRGECSLLEIVSTLPLFQQNERWFLSVLLPNKPRSLTTFTEKLGLLINIEQTTITTTKKGELGRVGLVVDFDTEKLSVLDFLKRILKIGYLGYEIQISPVI
ncbi:HD domain-containing protein [candidate division CSSED10-310 bacterium]|uniref:HD domain-containing protein n=1 Tax=candidate division CSSED10-310 bacterium TaxID=2855610 RepID=A0ABV6YW82_UNCC1